MSNIFFKRLILGHRKLWLTINEPRFVTLAMIGAYLVTLGVAYGLISRPPWGVDIDHPLHVGVVLFMAFAGLGGPISAWRGAWWFESAAVVAFIAGWGLLPFDLLSIASTNDFSTPWITVSACAVITLFGITRWARITKFAYRPGTGPLSPSERAHLDDALASEGFATNPLA